jgi:hypothetical protein
MGLTDEERRRLDDLAAELSRSDHGFARALTAKPLQVRLRARLHRNRRRLALLLATALALALAIIGVALQQVLLFAVGSVIAVAAALTLTAVMFGWLKP